MKWSIEDKEKAIQLRNAGKSFNEITSALGVSKSTLFTWVGAMPRPDKYVGANRSIWLSEIRKMGVQAIKKKKLDWVTKSNFEVINEVNSIKIDDSFKRSLLAMLYWAEGAKSGNVVQFVNVDSRLILLFVTLLRDCYELNENKFRVLLHLHEYHNAENAIKFWSKLTKIPENQFGKIYWKNRSKEKSFRKNEAGICTIRYNSVYLKERILQNAFALGENLASVAQRIE